MMNHIAFRLMAAEIIGKYKAGVEFAPETLGWATWIYNTQPKRMPQRLGEHQTMVLEALMQAPLEGLLFSELQAATGIEGDVLHQTVRKMIKHGLIVSIYIPHRSRYFLCDQWRELGRSLVEADESRLKASKATAKPLVVPKFVKPAPKKKASLPGRHPNKAPLTVKQKKHDAEPAYKHHTLNQPATGPVVSVRDMTNLPRKVKVTAPDAPPARFAVDEAKATGEGSFTADWRRLRGEPA